MQTTITAENRTPSASMVRFAHPFHLILLPFPIAYFAGALLTDIAYWKTAEMMWADFSAWLLFAGLVMGGLAAIAWLIDFFSGRLILGRPFAWIHTAGQVVVMLLALYNSFVHSRDAWTSVVPEGLIVSALTVIVMLVTSWIGRLMITRDDTGVAP